MDWVTMQKRCRRNLLTYPRVDTIITQHPPVPCLHTYSNAPSQGSSIPRLTREDFFWQAAECRVLRVACHRSICCSCSQRIYYLARLRGAPLKYQGGKECCLWGAEIVYAEDCDQVGWSCLLSGWSAHKSREEWGVYLYWVPASHPETEETVRS